MKLARHIRLLVSEAAKREADPAQPASLQPEWIPVDEMVRGALRFAYAASIKSNVDIGCRLPNRRCAVLIDRLQMGRVLQQLLLSAVKATPGGGSVRVAANRRSDGGLEIVFSSRGAGPLAVAHPQPEKTLDGAAWWDGLSMEGARRTIAAHRGIMTVESSAFGGTAVRLILPAQCTRDIAMSEGDGEGEGDPDVA
jgi:signal transduction histidine kinase